MIKKIPALLFLLCFFGTNAQTVFKDYVDGQLYVKFSGAALKPLMRENPANIPLSAFGSLGSCLQRYGVTGMSRPFYQASDDAFLPAVVKLCFSQSSAVTAFMKELAKAPGVEYAERVPLMRTDAMPNDPTFPSHLTQINAPSAWNVFNSTANGTSSVVVAIVDDAVMWSHADLSANIYNNAGEIPNNGIDDDNNGYIDDVHGYDVTDLDNNPAPTSTLMLHGTHCAGIAGARTDNSIGIASIGWNIKILPVKCQTDNGSPTVIANGYEGIIYAVRAKARVISCSWGGSGFAQTSQAVINYAWARGCLVIAAAGNSNVNAPNYPAAYPNVYCVAAVESNDVKSSYSNYGSWVDIAAPGSNINSTVPYSGATAVYQLNSGTSMATPLVAGLAGLMLSKSPQMTAGDITNCISSTAVNIYGLSGNTSYAAGSQLGAGRIDAFQAMNCAAAFLNNAPVANFFALPLITCPYGQVHFTDSSLYFPTSWQWTFQGGSPATSTLANPAVTWATPGIYSVSLTATNAHGSGVKNKVSYITVSAPGAVPLVEGFQNTQFLPAGWSPNNIGNDVVYWQRKTGLGGYGTSNACAMFDNYTYNTAGDRDEMRTPIYSFTNVATAWLRFDVAYARFDAINSDTLEVRLSTDCGASWTSIYLNGGTSLATAPDSPGQFSPGVTQWRTDSIDLTNTAAYHSSVMFSFVNHGQYGQPIYLDNINLSFPPPVGGMILPSGVCVNSPVLIAGSSTNAAVFHWEMPGGTPAVSTLTNPLVTYSVPGTYYVRLVSYNGKLTDTLDEGINVYSFPTASFVAGAASCSNCADGSLQAQPTAGTGPFTYSWMPAGGVSQTATGLVPGCYTVMITGQGCASISTACVSFVTGIAAISAEGEPLIYPNPASSSIQVDLDQPFSYALYNSAGQLIMKNKTNVASALIRLNDVAKGIYLLEINNGQQMIRKKIIIE